jgi:hypothetical protein
LRSWGTSVRSPPSQTPVGPLRLALEDDLRCGELLFAGGFRHLAGASILTIVAFSPPRGASVPPALVEQRQLPTTISLSKLNHAALALAVYASQLSFPLSRGRTATQDSLPAGGQPLPDGGHDPARSLVKFPPHLHGFLLIQAFATQSTAELGSDGSCNTKSA